jgi:hypothetical protein
VCKAHFTLGVKVKVKFKSSIPIDAITEISVKGFTIRVKAEKDFFIILSVLDAPREGL